ncbi:negative regulator of sigma E activity [Pelomonas saccharophila]|uniref:Negative regulator of sigma E activity n=1 Tax=Roseateles saccharophilus TaxID=304 RepID=A0ABU1YSJ5_ROSSA|nr:sigma-E factor negative regulatory protein [Roseateles saccharophilus]MDR7271824.1 negative regulator of sigma E activity [Roseateles saccharophilus]
MVSPVDEALNEALSAVMDGRATPADWARVNAAWAGDPGLRERWALWHAAGDGLRAELPALHREPEALLTALRAQLPVEAAEPRHRREWLAPLAVAASFVAFALGFGLLRPAPAGDVEIAAAPIATPRAQGLSGLSFAQTAAGRTLPDAPPEVIDWNLTLPEPAASQARP